MDNAALLLLLWRAESSTLGRVSCASILLLLSDHRNDLPFCLKLDLQAAMNVTAGEKLELCFECRVELEDMWMI